VKFDHRTFTVLLANHLPYYSCVIKAWRNFWTCIWLPVSYYSWHSSRCSLLFRLSLHSSIPYQTRFKRLRSSNGWKNTTKWLQRRKLKQLQ